MSELQDKETTEFGGDPFELALIVSNRIELEAVMLLDSQTWREPTFDFPDDPPTVDCGIERTSHGLNREERKIYVRIGFVSRDSGAEVAEPSIYLVKATFVLVYDITSLDGVEDLNLRAFSMTTGIYNAWPYWREFLQNTTTRMGLPPVVAPPFRFGLKDSRQ